MKIEKLTENKIRIIISTYDFEFKNMAVLNLTKTTFDKNAFFYELLEKAKKEVGFETDGYKLIVETFTSNEDFLVLTITKYSSSEKKKPIAKRKTPGLSELNYIYKFDNFKDFCKFCSCLNSLKQLNFKIFSKKIDLYYYQNTYYLLIKNINTSYKNQKIFYSIISEFSKSVSFSNAFENKLIEYGSLVIKKNAIEKGIKYLV